MPVVRIQRAELERLLPQVSIEEFTKKIPMIGADFKGISDNEIHVEFFPNRPDLYTVEGILRAAKGFFEIELGLPRYEVKDSNLYVEVDQSVKDVRPYIACSLIKNIFVDEITIKSFMEAQEKLHATYGRKRKKVAIGLHDFSKIKPPFRYIGADPDEYSFVPLGMDEELSLREILRKHPKGQEYGHIIEDKDKYPLILDSEGNVLSMPPIINGSLTEITEETRDIFIDVTGTDINSVENILNILVTSLADRGGEIYKCKVIYPEGERILPQLQPKVMNVSKKFIKGVIGIDMKDDEIIHSLKKMRYNAYDNGDNIKVEIGRFRVDILDKIDIVEDVAIGYGYENIREILPEDFTTGSLLKDTNYEEIIRRFMIGGGYQEVYTLTLASKKKMVEIFGIEEDFVEIVNPVSEDLNIVRSRILPNLMLFLADNTHREYPQKVFEVGRVVLKGMEWISFAGVTAHTKATFSEVKAILQKIFNLLGVKVEYKAIEKKYFIKGRSADITFKNKKIGELGEIHPLILEKLEIYQPVAGFEINLSVLEEIV